MSVIRQARPIAMKARWRIPPENSCGYWFTRCCRVRDPHHLEELDDLGFSRLALGDAVHLERFGDLLADAHQRVEVRHGVLRDESDAHAADRLHVAFTERGEVPPFEPDLAIRQATIAWEQSVDRSGGRRLSGPGLTNDGHRLARHHVDRHILYRQVVS